MVQVIPMGRSDIEDTGSPRIIFDLPPEYAGDGQWHEGFLKFDFGDNDKVAWVQPVLRINDGPAEFLVDDIAYVESLGPRLAIKELAIVEDAARPGEAGTLRVVLSNGGDAPAEGVALAVGLPEGLQTETAEKTIARLAPDAKATVEFPILGRRDKPSEIGVTATCAGCPPASCALEIAPGLEIVSFHAEPFVMEEHGNSTWIVVVRNPGNAIATGFKGVLDVPVGLHGEPIGDPLPGSLAPGQTISHRYRLTSERQAGRLMMGVKFNAGGLEASKEATLIVCGDRPLIPAQQSGGLVETSVEDGAKRRANVIGNDRVRIVFPECNWGNNPHVVGVGYVQTRRPDGWRDVGIMPSLGRVIWEKPEAEPTEFPLYTDIFQVTSSSWGGGKREDQALGATFRATCQDSGGALWQADVAFRVSGATDRVEVTSTLVCSKPRQVLAFEGPMVYWGEGAFGAEKTDAIFPGLEWLVNGEESSSTLDDISPAHMRYVPHPNKVTVPCMTLSFDGVYHGIEWDPHQKWDGVHDRPSVVFASPNRFEDTGSHLMGLFAPSVPDWVEENQREAYKPYLLKPGKTLSLSMGIFAGEGDALDGQVAWYREHNLTESLPMPRGDAQRELAFSMAAYTDSLWIPEEDTWWTSKGAGPLLSPKGLPAFFVDDLWLASTALKDPALKRKYRNLAQKMLDRLSLPAAGYPLAFRAGALDNAMLGQAGMVQSLIAAQRPDGSWRFDANKVDTGVFKGYDYHQLGPDDAAEVGTCAWNAYQVLAFARMTGDAQARAAGLKALAFMERFTVPRAAQVWEVPVHTPDVLAASDAVEAYLEGYQITGDKHHLQRAVYWAKAGLPFIYMWNAPEFKFMRYASIPVFGASQLKYSWFGRPVQWNGLRYGYALEKLARYDHTLDWPRLAHGLMVSAMYQQDEKGPNKALWPDSIGATKGDKAAWVFAPYQINKILYTELGLDPEPQTTVVGGVRLSSVARITSVRAEGGRIEATLEYPAGETTYLLVCGVSKPSRVSVTGQAFASTESLEVSSGTGWWYDPARATLIARIPHTGKDTLVIEGVSAAESRFLPEIAQQIAFEFDRPGDLEGWLPAHDITDMKIADGALRLSVTGGDPYLIRSGMRAAAASVKQVVIRMKTTAGAEAQFFWATDRSAGIDEPKSLKFAVVSDGQFHEYRVPVGAHPLWQGTITQLRLDPNQSQAGSRVEVDYIRGE